MKQQKTGRLSLRGWFGRMLRQPPRGFYGQPSVYLSGGVMEIEHFRRVRTYEEGRLCLEFAGGLFTVYGDGLRIERWPLTALPCGGGSCARIFPAVREGCSILQLWAGAAFSARNGDTDGLLSEAARTGLHLTDIFPAPGGFTARCAAWHYLRLAKLARKRRVHLRIRKRLVCFSFCGPTSGGGGCGPGFCCLCRFCFGPRALSGLWMLPA